MNRFIHRHRNLVSLKTGTDEGASQKTSLGVELQSPPSSKVQIKIGPVAPKEQSIGLFWRSTAGHEKDIDCTT